MASTTSKGMIPKRALKDATDNVGRKPAAKAGKAITVKDLNNKLKNSQKSELTSLLKHIFAVHPDVASTMLATFTPDFPVPEDPVVQSCFHCKSSEFELYSLETVKVCVNCENSVFKAINRAKMIDIFHFTKAEADKMKRSAPPGAYSGYRYEWSTIIKAIKKRDGSMFHFAENYTHNRYTTPTTGQCLEAADESEHQTIIGHALDHSKEASLKKLVQEAAKKFTVLKSSGGILDRFVPASMIA